MTEHLENEHIETPRWIGLAVGILAVVSLVALGIGWSASTHSKALDQSLTSQTQQLKQSADVLGQRLAQAEETNTQMQGDLNVVTSRLKLTQGELARARNQAKQAKEEEAKQLASVNTELSTKASADDVNKLGTDVNGVKTDLDSTKSNLQMARGELGTLIARNHDEIDQLRRLGERDYYEFTINRKGTRQKVGELTVELRGTNVNKNLFSVALFINDKRFEKRNRSVDEPIYFYSHGVHQPLELVVNQVGKDRIVGYLSVPKAGQQQQQQGSGE